MPLSPVRPPPSANRAVTIEDDLDGRLAIGSERPIGGPSTKRRPVGGLSWRTNPPSLVANHVGIIGDDVLAVSRRSSLLPSSRPFGHRSLADRPATMAMTM